MFNLNENNRFVMSRNPMDLRKGADSLCGAVRSCKLDPMNGDVYVFSNRSRTVLKLLHWERGGYTLYYKRLSVGRFHPKIFLREGTGFRSMRWDELVLLMEGISPQAARRKRYQPAASPGRCAEGGEKVSSRLKIPAQKVGYLPILETRHLPTGTLSNIQFSMNSAICIH